MRFKRLISGVIGFSVLAASMTAFAVDFKDVKGHWSEKYVNSMVAEGYIKGYDDGTFKPDKTVSNTEALILLSRMLGVEKSEYKDTVDKAVSSYSSTLAKYNTKYTNEIAYLLYRGVITSSDLNTYISTANKDKALLRYQCAMLITKLLGAQDEVTSGIFLSSSYSDTAQIPAEARPYVEYVREEKIMEGMGSDSYGDPIFGPMESVTRGQMAKMLSSLINVLNIKNVKGSISYIDETKETITVSGKTYTIEKNTVITVEGKRSSFATLSEDMNVNLFILKGKVSMLEATGGSIVDYDDSDIVRGLVVSANTTTGNKTLIVSEPEDKTERTTYDVDDDVKVIIDDKTGSFTSLKNGQYVELVVDDDDVVTQIEVVDKNATIYGTLVSKDVSSKKQTITIENTKGVKVVYECSEDGVDVTRNDHDATLLNLVAGDDLTIRLVYNKVTVIKAESETQRREGKIESITHTANGTTVTVIEKNKTNTYTISPTAEIIIDDEEDDYTAYDLRPGCELDFRTDSTTIIEIETTQVVSVSKIEGEVTNIQTKHNLIFVDDGYEEMTVLVNSSTTVINGATGDSMRLADIDEGDEVEIRGSNSSGAFVAKVIIVY